MAFPAPVDFVEYILRKYARQNNLVLDVGCGPALYRNSTAARYVGIDITIDPYNEDCPRDVDVVADATWIPFSESIFDLVFSLSAFFQFPSPENTLKEFYRVLKDGGRVIIFDYTDMIFIKYLLLTQLPHSPPIFRPFWAFLGLIRMSGSCFHAVFHFSKATFRRNSD